MAIGWSGLHLLYRAGDRRGRLLAVGIGLSDYLDVLVAPDCRDAVLAAIGAAVETLAGWQEWELTDMAPFAAGRALPHLSSCACEETPAAARYGLALDGEPGGSCQARRHASSAWLNIGRAGMGDSPSRRPMQLRSTGC